MTAISTGIVPEIGFSSETRRKNAELLGNEKEGNHVKELPIAIAPLVILMLISFVPSKHSFNGEIMDSQCGEMGLHDVVVNTTKTAKECTIDCVRLGGKYVLYDPATRMAYGLDDQQKPGLAAGDKVEVIGTLDKVTHMIHVIDIQSVQ